MNTVMIAWLVIAFGGGPGQIQIGGQAAVAVPEPDLQTCQAVAQQIRMQAGISSAICVPGTR